MRQLLASIYHGRAIQSAQDFLLDCLDALIGFRERSFTDKEICLFWARSVPNFGDALSLEVVSRLSGAPVFSAPPGNVNIVAIGSIYPWLKFKFRRRFHKIFVWGTGCLSSKGYLRADNGFDVRLVRGPITAKSMGLKQVPYGDPGLLADQIYNIDKSTVAGRIGIVLHVSHYRDISDTDKDYLFSKYYPIDARTFEPRKVVEEIATCERIISSSLHGIIVADSFSIPNLALECRATDFLKFEDYCSGAGSEFSGFISLEDILSGDEKIKSFRQVDEVKIRKIKSQIISSFPFERGEPLPMEIGG